jgi:hypothetical protein
MELPPDAATADDQRNPLNQELERLEGGVM